jgi:hypothetical protein
MALASLSNGAEAHKINNNILGFPVKTSYLLLVLPAPPTFNKGKFTPLFWYLFPMGGIPVPLRAGHSQKQAGVRN